MRTLKLYGINNAEYKVYINNEQSQSFASDLIYTFDTDTTLHGSYNIRIEVVKGTLTLEKCLVDYPATLNGKKGIMTMDQPIQTPLYKWTGEELVAQPFPITIDNGEIVEFEHLMFNGATFFEVELKHEVGNKVYVGDLITKTYNPELRDFRPIFDYEPEDWNVWSKESLQKLIDVVTKKLTTKDKDYIIN